MSSPQEPVRKGRGAGPRLLDVGGNATPKRRADAQANVERILRAAMARFAVEPEASMGQVAADAGVGRVTLYAHYPSREVLVEAALTQALADGDAVLAEVDLTDPVSGLRDLIVASWQLTAQASALLEAARHFLTDQRIRDMHVSPEQRVLDLIERGQAEGAFRTDMPATWLAGVMHHLMKGVASDVTAGHLDTSSAADLLAETVLSAYRPRA